MAFKYYEERRSGKGRDVSGAIRKAVDDGKRNLIKVPIVGTSIPMRLHSEYCGAKCFAAGGYRGGATGIIAGPVQAVWSLAGSETF